MKKLEKKEKKKKKDQFPFFEDKFVSRSLSHLLRYTLFEARPSNPLL
jgi:hypothetical protein